MSAPRIDPQSPRYRALVGVGGIGAGSFFAISGNETLGREESRAGRYLDQRDYCKLHIITHYICRLLGPAFRTITLGKVGDDDTGHRIVAEMDATGLDVRYVEKCPGEQTLFSFCFLYPDGSGGNLTTADSASSRVDAAYVESVRHEFESYRGQGVALAAPETPLESRSALLKLATENGFFRAASFTAEEIPAVLASGLLKHVDLLALNQCEAAAALGTQPEGLRSAELAERAVGRLRRENPNLRLSVTAGKHGSWLWDTRSLHFQPGLRVAVRNTAGAGDSHLGALVVGTVAGLPTEAKHELASLVASFSVTSQHSIHPGVDRASLLHFARECDAPVSVPLLEFLSGE